MRDVSKLLDTVIDLIERDVNEISKQIGKLDFHSSQDICRYSNALLALNSTLEDRERAEKNKVARMSTEELEKRARELLEKRK